MPDSNDQDSDEDSDNDDDNDIIVEVDFSTTWDGRDEAGELLPDGDYSYLALGNLIKVRSPDAADDDGSSDDDSDSNDSDDRSRRVFATSFPVTGEIQLEDTALDTTPPVITATVSPGPNGDGWNNTVPVTVSFDCTDDQSGVDTVTPPAP